MDEREDWKPIIFFSGGVHTGEEEPFPEPTHLRRKERSAVNRGTLYSANSPHPNSMHAHAGHLSAPARGMKKGGVFGMGRDEGFERGRGMGVK